MSELIKKNVSWQSTGIALFLLGFLSPFYILIFGQLYITEIIFLAILPFLLLRRHIRLSPELRTIFWLGILWLFGQMLTDLVRATPVDDLLRGWAGIVFLILDIFVLQLLIRQRKERFMTFLFGYVTGGLVVPFVQPSPFFEAEPWKFGFGRPVVLSGLLLVIFFCRGNVGRMRRWALFLLGLGILSFYLNARALGGAVILSALLLWARFSPMLWKWFAGMRVKTVIMTGLFLVAFTWGILSGYVYLGKKGMLPQKLQNKFAMQYTGSAVSVLLGGRTEILASSQAVIDSPILGHGSWAEDIKYRFYLYELIDLGYQRNETKLTNHIYESNLIPAHSHLMQAWVWAGLLGAVFWVWILAFIGRVLKFYFAKPDSWYALIVFLCISAFWDILFSPFGAQMRLYWGTVVGALSIAYRHRSTKFLTFKEG